jgi:deoxyribonuclease-4
MNIGTHISKKGGFLKTLQRYYSDETHLGTPVQLFSGSPKIWRRPTVDETEQTTVKKCVTENNLSVFIHSIYLINLCWEEEKLNTGPQECLKWELANGSKMGFKGVVVHCGKYCKMDQKVALDNMYINIKNILSFVDPECPLLLETSTGQGTETCFKYDDFKEFYLRFDESERQLLKICIDTCHVFAGGHNPLEFITNWEKDVPNSLVLVHYNDSKGTCGCKKDRHEVPGKGEIGEKMMQEIALLCNSRNIPMVIE